LLSFEVDPFREEYTFGRYPLSPSSSRASSVSWAEERGGGSRLSSISDSYYPSGHDTEISEVEEDENDDAWSDTFESQPVAADFDDGDKTPVGVPGGRGTTEQLRETARRLNLEADRNAHDERNTRTDTLPRKKNRPPLPPFARDASKAAETPSEPALTAHSLPEPIHDAAEEASSSADVPKQSLHVSPSPSSVALSSSPSHCPHCAIHSWLPHSMACSKWKSTRRK
jgi:hypothetical protein